MEQFNNTFQHFIPFFILINFILLISLTFINIFTIWEFLKNIKIKIWVLIFIIFIVALVVRIYLPPHQHIIYIDEQWYMEVAKNMLLNKGNTLSDGFKNYPYSKSIGWPFILNISFAVFGINNWVAIYTSLLFGGLTIFLFFFLVYVITENEKISILAILLFSLVPFHISFSGSAETYTSSLFFILLSLFFSFLFFKHKKLSLLWLALSAISFAAQFRPENYLYFLLFFLGISIYKIKISDDKLFIPFAIFLIISLPNLIQILDFYLAINWMQSDTGGVLNGVNWSLAHFSHNTLNYGIHLFGYKYHSIISSLFLILGIIFTFIYKRQVFLFFIFWFFSLYILYFASWLITLHPRSGILINFYPSIIIFVVYGIYFLCNVLLKIIPSSNKVVLALFITAIVLLGNFPYIVKYSQEFTSDVNKLETKIPELAEKDIPPNCIILANWPTILKSTTNLNVLDLGKFLKYKKKRNIIKTNNCVLFFDDFTCNWQLYNYLKKNCVKIKDYFKLSIFKKYSEGKLTYSFYKIK